MKPEEGRLVRCSECEPACDVFNHGCYHAAPHPYANTCATRCIYKDKVTKCEAPACHTPSCAVALNGSEGKGGAG